MNQEKVGKFIAQLRKEKKMTQAQLGEKLGVTDKAVSKWEKGITAPNISILNDLSKILEISTTELLNGEKLNNISPQKIDETVYKNINFYAKINEKKYIKKFSVLVASAIFFFLVILIYLFCNNNYDNCYIYELESQDNKFEIQGILSLTTEKDIIIVNSVKNISAFDLDSEKLYSYQYALKIDDKELYKNGSIIDYHYQKGDTSVFLNDILEQIKIYLSEESNYEASIPNNIIDSSMYLEVKYINQEFEEKVLNFSIKLNKIFSNNKIFYNGGNNF